MNPLDEYFMEKEAFNFGAAAQQAGQAAKGIAGSDVAKGIATSVGAMALMGAGVPAAQKIWSAVTRRGDFKEMMNVNPDLREVQQEDPRFFNHAYNSLRKVNPTFGRDPIIAGSYMKKMMANKDAAGLTLATSVKTPEAGPARMPFNLELGYTPSDKGAYPMGMSGKGKYQR